MNVDEEMMIWASSNFLDTENNSLVDILKSDADFLARCGIIDYSLLLGEIEDDPEKIKAKMAVEKDKTMYRGLYFTSDDKPYLIGVIDPLTGFK